MSKNFWLGAAAYILPTFPLGYLWHLSIFKANYDSLGLYRQEVMIPLGLGSMIIQGLILSYLYPMLFSTVRADWTASGLRFFGIFGILTWSFVVLPVAAKYNMTSVSHFMALETAFTAIQFAIAGMLMALAWRDSK